MNEIDYTDEHRLECLKKAGKVVSEAKKLAEKLCKPDAKVVDIAEEVESFIMKKTGNYPAFPFNYSVNDEAAHFTPNLDYKGVVGEDEIIKLDMGSHFDGYIADSAVTVSTSGKQEHLDLIEASETGLDAAIKIIRPGITIGEIGAAVETAIEEKGFKTIQNLTGHAVEQYNLHAGLTIPNIKNNSTYKLVEGQSIAIEPFATNGAGVVYDSQEIQIYMFYNDIPTRNPAAREIMNFAKNKVHGLPFAKRWLEKEIGQGMKLEMAMRELIKSKAIYQYPLLKEKNGGLIAQAEHTLIVYDNPIITSI